MSHKSSQNGNRETAQGAGEKFDTYVFPLSSYLLTPQPRILGKPSLCAHRVPLRRSALAEPGFFIVLRVSAPGARIDPGVVKPLSLSCSFGLLLLLPSSVDERRRTSAIPPPPPPPRPSLVSLSALCCQSALGALSPPPPVSPSLPTPLPPPPLSPFLSSPFLCPHFFAGEEKKDMAPRECWYRQRRV